METSTEAANMFVSDKQREDFRDVAFGFLLGSNNAQQDLLKELFQEHPICFVAILKASQQGITQLLEETEKMLTDEQHEGVAQAYKDAEDLVQQLEQTLGLDTEPYTPGGYA
jgi:hypothetical protein